MSRIRDADIGQTFDMLGMTIDVHKASSNGSYYQCKHAYFAVNVALDLYNNFVCGNVAYPSSDGMGVHSLPDGNPSAGLDMKVLRVLGKEVWIDDELLKIQRGIEQKGNLRRAKKELWSLYNNIRNKVVGDGIEN